MVEETPSSVPAEVGAAPRGDGAAGAAVTLTHGRGTGSKEQRGRARGSSQSSSQVPPVARSFFQKMSTKL